VSKVLLTALALLSSSRRQNAALFAENDTLKQRVTQLENLLAAAQQQSAPGRQAEHRRSMSFRVPQRSSGMLC
jgi:hypothetical protein